MFCMGSDGSILLAISSLKLCTLLFKSSLLIITIVFPSLALVMVSCSDSGFRLRLIVARSCCWCIGLTGCGYFISLPVLSVDINLMASRWLKSFCWAAFSVPVIKYSKSRFVRCSRLYFRPICIILSPSGVKFTVGRLHTLKKTSKIWLILRIFEKLFLYIW